MATINNSHQLVFSIDELIKIVGGVHNNIGGKESRKPVCIHDEIFTHVVETNCINNIKIMMDDPRFYPSYGVKIASSNGYYDVMKLLLSDSRVSPAIDNNYPIRYASHNGHTKIVKLLLKDYRNRTNPAADDNYAIRVASEFGHTDIVKLLLKVNMVDPSVNNNYPIRIATDKNYISIIKLLLSHKDVDPTFNNNNLIVKASTDNNVDIVHVLLKNDYVGLDPAASNNRAIRCASRHGNAEIVLMLLVSGRVDPSAKNNYAIRTASKYGHTEIVDLLLSDERVCLSDRLRPILLASGNGHVGVVQRLLLNYRIRPIEMLQAMTGLINSKSLGGDVIVRAVDTFLLFSMRTILSKCGQQYVGCDNYIVNWSNNNDTVIYFADIKQIEKAMTVSRLPCSDTKPDNNYILYWPTMNNISQLLLENIGVNLTRRDGSIILLISRE
jgi:ankyrin repeat protein